jgi:methylenetetrahydrofolate dehydrogenase (NADP+)/methenyltetrahydrofolate cyclohydrolase
MAAQLLSGRGIANQIREEMAAEVSRFAQECGRVPSLAVVRAGEDAASVSYTRMLIRTCEQVGIAFEPHILPADVPEEKLISLVRELSASESVDGIIVQEPLPEGCNAEAVIAALDPVKDVDGVHPSNAGRLFQGVGNYYVPATPAGGMELLERYGIPVKGKRAVVVGRSNVVGRPMAMLLLHRHATVTICHSRTENLAEECRRAEILVAATGKPKLITGDMVSPGVVVVDFGVNFLDGQMVGDVDFDSVAEKASWITPVPGGTGPMTNVMLMRNVLMAARARQARAETK